MINNSTNINIMNNHLSPQIIEHKKTTTYGVEKPDHGFILFNVYCFLTCMLNNSEAIEVYAVESYRTII